jgi:hypothetical protein
MYKKEQLLELRQQLDLRVIIAETIVPKFTRGKSWKFPCPFHQDGRTPNLYVYTDGYQCYAGGCGANGTVFDWFRHVHKESFQDAVKRAEQLTNCKVSQTEDRRILTRDDYEVLGLESTFREGEGTDLWRLTLQNRTELLVKRSRWLLDQSITVDVKAETESFLNEVLIVAKKAGCKVS